MAKFATTSANAFAYSMTSKTKWSMVDGSYVSFPFKFPIYITSIYLFFNSLIIFLFSKILEMADLGQASSLLQKLTSSVSQDVRKRSLATLYSKISCNLIAIEDLCSNFPEAPAQILYWMQDFHYSVPEELLQKAVFLLKMMSREDVARRRMRQSSAPAQFLCDLKNWQTAKGVTLKDIDECLQNIADMSGKENQFLSINLPSNFHNKSETSSLVPIGVEHPQMKEQAVKVLERPDGIFNNNINRIALTIEYIFLPAVRVLEIDEKTLFDVQVQIKFGNAATVLSTLRDQLPEMIRSYPVEVFKAKYEIVQELIVLCQSKEEQVVYYALTCLFKIIRHILKRLRIHPKWLTLDHSTKTTTLSEHIRQSYPGQPGSEPIAANQKSIKDLVEMTAIGLVTTGSLPGLRVRILKNIIEIITFVQLINPLPAQHSALRILSSIGKVNYNIINRKYFDQQECAVTNQANAPLFLVATQLFTLITDNHPDLKSIINHLCQAQFSYILTKDQSQTLLIKLAHFNSDIVVHSGRIEEILNAVTQLWAQSHLNDSHEIICLSPAELAHAIQLLTSILLAIPIAENLAFIKHYVQTYLYTLSSIFPPNDQLIQQSEENFLIMIHNPCKVSQQIAYSTILSSLQDNNYLKHPKANNNHDSISNLTKEMLTRPNILNTLYNNSLIDQDIKKTMIEILIALNSKSNDNICLLLLAPTILLHNDKKSEFLVKLLTAQNKTVYHIQQFYNFFSKNKQTRSQAIQFVLGSSIFQQSGECVRQNYSLFDDPFEELLNEQQQLKYSDTVDDQLRSISINVRQTEVCLDVSVEQISNLENMVCSKEIELHLRASGIQQLTDLYLLSKNFEKDFARACGVKSPSLHQFWDSVIENLFKMLQKENSLFQTEFAKSVIYQNYLQNLFDFLAVYLSLSDKSELKEMLSVEALFRDSGPLIKLLQMIFFLLKQIHTSKPLRFSLLRIFHVLVFQQGHDQIQMVPMKQKQIIQRHTQNWALYYPLSKNVQWYVTQYINHIKCGLTYELYQKQHYLIPKSDSISQDVDLYIAFKSQNISVSQEGLLETLNQTVLSPSFLGSPKMFLLGLLSEDQIFSDIQQALIKQVQQLFFEATEQESILPLLLQLSAIAKRKLPKEINLLKVLKRTPYNQKAIYYILKLLKARILHPSAELITYLQSYCLQCAQHLNFHNTHLTRHFMSMILTLGIDLFQELDPIDQQVLFSQVLFLTQNHLSIVRVSALQILSNKNLIKEQQERLAERCIEAVFSESDCEPFYSLACSLLASLVENELVLSLLTTKRITAHVSSYLKNNDKNPLIAASLINLLLEYTKFKREDSIPLLYSFHLDQQLSNIKFTKSELDKSCLMVASSCQLLVFLMKQSVSVCLQLLQSCNLIENTLKNLRKLGKYGNNINSKLLGAACQEACLIIQLGSLYHGDYVCVELRRCERKKLFESLFLILQCDKMPIDCVRNISRTFPITISQGYTCHVPGDLLLMLNSYQDKELIPMMGSIACICSEAKADLVRCGVALQICNELQKEIDQIIYQEGDKKKKVNVSQSFAGEGLGLQNSIGLIKLLFASVENEEQSSAVDSFGNVIVQCLQIVSKLMHLSVKYNTAIDYYVGIMVNLASNKTLSNMFVQKMSESKFSLLNDMIKTVSKQENIKLEHFEGLLRCLSVMGQNGEFRLVYYRTKLFEDLNEKLYKAWEKKKTWSVTNGFAAAISHFHCSLSFHKDAHQKILNNSQTMNLFITLILDHGGDEPFTRDLLLTLTNIAINRKTKSLYLANTELPALVMHIITDAITSLQNKKFATQMLVNLFYKSTQSISQFNRPEVIEELSFTMRDFQRQNDKIAIQLQNTNLQTEKASLDEKRKDYQEIQNTINQILKILQIDW